VDPEKFYSDEKNFFDEKLVDPKVITDEKNV